MSGNRVYQELTQGQLAASRYGANRQLRIETIKKS
jgi:hypothetical protein